MATVKIPEQKVILVGEWGVGKSSLFRRFAMDSFTTASDRKSTLGLDFVSKVFHTQESSAVSKDIKLQLWDTGGLERVASVTSSYYKFSEGALLVFSLADPESFNTLPQHLLEVVSHAENAKIFLCGNKSDLEDHQVQITDENIEDFCEQCPTISGVYKTSCRTGHGVQDMFQDIANVLASTNRGRLELQSLESSESSFKLGALIGGEQSGVDGSSGGDCSC